MSQTSHTLARAALCLRCRRVSHRPYPKDQTFSCTFAPTGSRRYAVGPLPAEENGEIAPNHGRVQAWGVGMHNPTDHYRCLSMCETSPPLLDRGLCPFPCPTHRISLDILHHDRHPVVMDHWVLVLGRRKGIAGKVWRGIQSLSSTGAYALPEYILHSQDFFQAH